MSAMNWDKIRRNTAGSMVLPEPPVQSSASTPAQQKLISELLEELGIAPTGKEADFTKREASSYIKVLKAKKHVLPS